MYRWNRHTDTQCINGSIKGISTHIKFQHKIKRRKHCMKLKSNKDGSFGNECICRCVTIHQSGKHFDSLFTFHQSFFSIFFLFFVFVNFHHHPLFIVAICFAILVFIYTFFLKKKTQLFSFPYPLYVFINL